MSRSDGNRSKDYERAVVVEAEVKEEQRKTTLRSERRSALKKDLTGPTLLEMSVRRLDREWRRDDFAFSLFFVRVNSPSHLSV